MTIFYRPLGTSSSRPEWWETNLSLAYEYARRGTCLRGQNGAIIVTPGNRPLSLGYNGAPRGQDHCVEVGCRIGKDGSCIRAVHAEINAIINAAAHGSRTEGGELFSTHRPCLRVCAPAIINAGIVRVVWNEPYQTDGAEADVIAMFRISGVLVQKVEEGRLATLV